MYEERKDEDGFLYITYSGENTFGSGAFELLEAAAEAEEEIVYLLGLLLLLEEVLKLGLLLRVVLDQVQRDLLVLVRHLDLP